MTPLDNEKQENRLDVVSKVMHFVERGVSVGLIVPTLNAGIDWPRWLAQLKSQTLQPDRVLIVDSSSTDNTAALALEAGYDVTVIQRSEFNHGTTRQVAAETLGDMDILVYMTQDAVLVNELSLANLISVFRNGDVAVAYGRQLPHRDSGLIGAHARLYNYSEDSEIRSLVDRRRLGIKVAFSSNSFAAYRRTVLSDVGGFPSNNIFGEDTYVVSKILLSGKSIGYCADAQVYHSHDYTFTQDFKRCFDIGVFHAREPWLREKFGSAEGEGKKFILSEFKFLMKKQPILLISAFFRSGLKYIAYRSGLLERLIPLPVKRKLSMHSRYWQEK